MKLIGMLSYFNESPSLLSDCISRLRAVGIDHLIACDGAYDCYPAENRSSPYECFKAILDSTGGLSTMILCPSGWSGNEVEKRNFMLERALEIAQEGDWLLVADADHLWEGEPGLKGWLEATRANVAQVSIAESVPNWYPARLLYRAAPGMHYDGAHWRLRFPDSSVSTTLVTDQEKHTAPTLDLTFKFHVRHVVYEQSPERRERQAAYYNRRDQEELES